MRHSNSTKVNNKCLTTVKPYLYICPVVLIFTRCPWVGSFDRRSYPRGRKLTFSRCLGMGNLTLASMKGPDKGIGLEFFQIWHICLMQSAAHTGRGQTSEHAREITRELHRSIRKTLHVASFELEAKYSFYFNEIHWR